MKFIVYLLTLFFVGTAVAQNPTILQGSYVSNVFGQSNFVLNPNAQTNVANVTVSNATVTRSTTTPLVATTEFNITTSTATGYADWATRTFDQGMKGQNCEARFTYRGFSVGSTSVQIRQNSNTVAQLTLTASTDPRIASINFPCGDLSTSTVFRLQQSTAALTGTNEIGGIYVGLATNQANVAQAENVVQASRSTTQSFTSGSDVTIIFSTETKDTYGEFDPSTGVFTAKRAGDYLISTTWLSDLVSWTAGNFLQLTFIKNSSAACRSYRRIDSTQTMNMGISNTCVVSLSVGDTLKSNISQNQGTLNSIADGTYVFTSISRFPTSSELVVTPERQNVYGGVVYTSGNQAVRQGNAADVNYYEFNNATWNQPTMLKGKAAVTTTGSGNDLGFSIPNMPVGNYKFTVTGLIQADAGASGTAAAPQSVQCNFKIRETTIGVDVARQSHQDKVYNTSPLITTRDWTNAFSGIFTNTSVGTRNFRLEANKQQDNTTGNGGACQAYAATSSGGLNTNLSLLIEPLDQPSNSALYVQGPVLASQTGAAIPEGYQNEWSTRSISDTSLRTQASPVAGTWYYPWTGELTLPAGNWNICYTVFAQYFITSGTSTWQLSTRIENKTDAIEVVKTASWPQVGPTYTDIGQTHHQCRPIAITTSKVFRVGLVYSSLTGGTSPTNIYLRGDVVKSELYAIRLN